MLVHIRVFVSVILTTVTRREGAGPAMGFFCMALDAALFIFEDFGGTGPKISSVVLSPGDLTLR